MVTAILYEVMLCVVCTSGTGSGDGEVGSHDQGVCMVTGCLLNFFFLCRNIERKSLMWILLQQCILDLASYIRTKTAVVLLSCLIGKHSQYRYCFMAHKLYAIMLW